MSTIKSSAENLTLNADGANNDIKFQSNGSEVASIDQAGLFIANKLKVGTGDNGTITSTHALALDAPSGEPLLFRTNGTDIARFRPGGGLCFGTDTAAANALDDYEEGTWTPTLIGSGGGTGTWASSVNSYTKVGRVVHFNCYLQCSSLGNMSNAVIIDGLPFTNASAGGYQAATVGNATGLDIDAGDCMTAFVDVNSTRIYPRLWNATTGIAAYGFYIGELTSDGSLMIAGSYFAA